MTPDAFRARLTVGVADGSIKFTNSGDVGLVADIYERGFLHEFKKARSLNYMRLRWRDEEACAVASAISYARLHSAFERCELVRFVDNDLVTEAGLSAIHAALDPDRSSSAQAPLAGRSGTSRWRRRRSTQGEFVRKLHTA